MDYYSYLEQPTLDGLSLDHTPRPGLGVSISTWWYQVTGESGASYNTIRAIGMPNLGQVLNFGTYRGSDDIDTRAELLIPYSEQPVVEPCWMERGDKAIVYGSPSSEIEMSVDGYRWRDANGRIELNAVRLGDVCSYWAPPQPGLEHGFLDRSHLCTVTGTIDGDPVEGMFMHDHVYSKPGLPLSETGLLSTVENYWMQWWVEYDDGSTEGGSAWRGQPGSGFTHAHHYADGRSRARRDGVIDVARNANGSITHMTLSLGSEVRFEFEQIGSYDWPLHTYGKVSSCTRDREIVKSWHYVENWPTNMKLIEDYQLAYERLYQRPASLKNLLIGARIHDEALVLIPPNPAAAH